MKRFPIPIILSIILPCLALSCTTPGKFNNTGTQSSVSFVFAHGAYAQRLLLTEDIFLSALSPFDRSSRLKTSSAVSMAEYLEFISEQALDWTVTEMDKVTEAMRLVNRALIANNFLINQEIIFVKTTGLEEGNAAYCRGNNIIVLPAGYINLPMDRLYNLLLHELFHIYSRNNPVIQEELYAILSFRKTNELQLPEAIYRYKITNPDAASNNYYFTARVNGNEYKLMPILLASSGYDEEQGGEFFEYLGLYFAAISENANSVSLLIQNDSYVIFTPNQVPVYFDLIGGNTDYIIHPEEILADNFVFMINNRRNLPNMEIIERMRSVLKI